MLCSVFTVAALAASVVYGQMSPAPKGFVIADGKRFLLDGKPFYFAGANSYWVQFTQDPAQIGIIFDRALQAGHKVIRTWGFNEMNATKVTGGLPQYNNDISDTWLNYFQSWSNGTATLNEGSRGLAHFDQLIKIAEDKGVKLIVALTNNWADYGGMDVYTINLGGKYHDEFFYNEKVVAAFKTYVSAIVKRYASSPAIFAWELGNEPRCGADGQRNLPRSPSGCNTQVVTKWADDLSTFIKSIDPFHMVTIGDEGFFNDAKPDDPSDWAYTGADGVDFVNNLKLKNIDFGTFHLYPDWWTKSVDWATAFVERHIQAMNDVGKPVVLEEYGWLTPETRQQYLGRTSNISRVEAVGSWQRASVRGKLGGDLYWQLGIKQGLSGGASSDDGFTIYLEDTEESKPLIFDHVAAVEALNAA